MKRILFIAALFAVVSCGGGRDNPTTDPTDPVTPTTPTEEKSFARGADVSWLSEMENDGIKFYKADGTQTDLLAILKELGFDAVRLRVWVDPEGGWSGKSDVVALAKRAVAAGMNVMIDFHYSDFFADPSRQVIPAAWSADKDDLTKMAAHVKSHTNEVLSALKSAGVTPKWVQIGNETRNGMLWPAGQLWTSSGDITDGYKHFAALYNAGYDAAKAVFSSVVVMPHLNNAYDDNTWWFTKMKNAGVKMDAIALSHYPQAESKYSASQYNTKAVESIKSLYSTFNVPIYIAEVGVKPAKSDAASVMSSFISSIKDLDGCEGVFYWEPEVYGGWKPAVYSDTEALSRLTGTTVTSAWGAYDQGAFTSEGKPHAILDAFKK